MYASKNGFKQIAEILLQNNAEVDAKTSDGKTALMIAAENCYNDIVEILLQKNASVNAKSCNNETALIYALKNRCYRLDNRSNIDVVQMLLENGADINVKDEEGKTLLDLAKEQGYDDVQRLLTSAADTEFWKYFVNIYQSIYNDIKTIIEERFLKYF